MMHPLCKGLTHTTSVSLNHKQKNVSFDFVKCFTVKCMILFLSINVASISMCSISSTVSSRINETLSLLPMI